MLWVIWLPGQCHLCLSNFVTRPVSLCLSNLVTMSVSLCLSILVTRSVVLCLSIVFYTRPVFLCMSIQCSRTCLKRPLRKKTKIGFQYRLSLNAGQKYCRMLQWEHFAILSTFIKLPFDIKILVLSIFEWPLKTGFTVISLSGLIYCV